MKGPARVLIVEDDPPIRSALQVALAGEGFLTRTAEDGTALEKVTTEFQPDLAILDVHLPAGPDGYGIAQMIRNSNDLPVLFLTAADSIQGRLKAFDVGADDYMTKPFSMAELIARVRALLRRCGRLSASVWRIGDLVVDDGARKVTRNGHEVVLTETEYEILNVLGSHPGQVLSKVQLLARVWGFDAYDTNLVEVHVSALRRKLEAHGDRLVHTVRGAGYVIRKP